MVGTVRSARVVFANFLPEDPALDPAGNGGYAKPVDDKQVNGT
jgi:hypothetical protein